MIRDLLTPLLIAALAALIAYGIIELVERL
jgi:hypothetical protein